MEVKKETTFSALLVLMMLLYPTALGFVFAARLATFALVIPTPTVPGAPLSSSDSGTQTGTKLRDADDLWETAGAGAVVRTGFALTSIAVVHLFLLCYLVAGPPAASYMATHAGRVWTRVASLAFWFITTGFLLTYTSMARYGAHSLEWTVAGLISLGILVPTCYFPVHYFCPHLTLRRQRLVIPLELWCRVDKSIDPLRTWQE